MLIKNYKINNFVLGTLKRFNLKTRVGLNNKTGEDCLILGNVKNFLGENIDKNEELLSFGVVKNGSSKHITQEDVGDSFKEELIYEFALVPTKLNSETKEKDIEIDKQELKQWCSEQDHYVEYYNDNTSAGVLYNVVPQNHKELFTSSCVIIQSPKVFLTDDINTYIQFINYSSDFAYNTHATLKCKLLNENGDKIIGWDEIVPPNGMSFVDVKKVFMMYMLKYKDFGNFFQFQAVSDNFVIPLFINRNNKYNTYSLEHSLPPVAYDSNCYGQHKVDVVRCHLENW